jgi:hypothetical protein
VSETVRDGFGCQFSGVANEWFVSDDPGSGALSLLGRPMLKAKLLIFFAALMAAGCMTEGQFLASRQPTAMEVAVRRGQSEMNCPSATGEMLSQEFTQAVQTPIVQAGYSGLFTIGVTGCGQRRVYQVFCAMKGDGCTALEGQTK